MYKKLPFFICRMNFFVISVLAIASLSLLQTKALGTTADVQETPLALPVAEQTQPTTSAQGEIWEEDDHEILIRNERGTKSDGK